jgi:hypothetical protein
MCSASASLASAGGQVGRPRPLHRRVVYDWALIGHPDPTGALDPGDEQCWWRLVRRQRHTGEPAFYRCYSPLRTG